MTNVKRAAFNRSFLLRITLKNLFQLNAPYRCDMLKQCALTILIYLYILIMSRDFRQIILHPSDRQVVRCAYLAPSGFRLSGDLDHAALRELPDDLAAGRVPDIDVIGFRLHDADCLEAFGVYIINQLARVDISV